MGRQITETSVSRRLMGWSTWKCADRPLHEDDPAKMSERLAIAWSAVFVSAPMNGHGATATIANAGSNGIPRALYEAGGLEPWHDR